MEEIHHSCYSLKSARLTKNPLRRSAKEPSGDKEPRRGFLRGQHLHTYSEITKPSKISWNISLNLSCFSIYWTRCVWEQLRRESSAAGVFCCSSVRTPETFGDQCVSIALGEESWISDRENQTRANIINCWSQISGVKPFVLQMRRFVNCNGPKTRLRRSNTAGFHFRVIKQISSIHQRIE